MTDNYRKNAKVEEEQPFPLEKILTVSAGDYCASQGKQLCDYELVAVHVKKVVKIIDLDSCPDIKEELVMNVPPSTEIVVGYLPSIAMEYFFVQYADATALVPRYKDEFEEDYLTPPER